MKTPEEIKKGMACCLTRWEGDYLASCHTDCPYRNEGIWCRNALMHDITERYKQLKSRLAQVERERDAAVNDLYRAFCQVPVLNIDCYFCKSKDKETCDECFWQWRGVCPENTKEDDHA